MTQPSEESLKENFMILAEIHGCKMSLEDCNSASCQHYYTCRGLFDALAKKDKRIEELEKIACDQKVLGVCIGDRLSVLEQRNRELSESESFKVHMLRERMDALEQAVREATEELKQAKDNIHDRALELDGEACTPNSCRRIERLVTKLEKVLGEKC